ncbi:MAG: hypothetical protein ISN26_07645 [Betaproteobacteria bacterium AqS2]|uniref:Uncharacterized protein n=1 Tax=Candidatus Amphirhobacter heronislandensis TaxID=1732024 RepID=A0A930UIY0_9GAMM|nr:hypothetical protein [Betaproteobacteria bacterium AqS2]
MQAVAILAAVLGYLLAFLVIASFVKNREEQMALFWLFFCCLPWLAFELWAAFGT